MQFFAERVVTDEAADGRHHVDERHREQAVEERGAGHVAKRSKPGIEGHAVEKQPQDAKWQEQQKLERAHQHSENGKHVGRRARNDGAHAPACLKP